MVDVMADAQCDDERCQGCQFLIWHRRLLKVGRHEGEPLTPRFQGCCKGIIPAARLFRFQLARTSAFFHGAIYLYRRRTSQTAKTSRYASRASALRELHMKYHYMTGFGNDFESEALPGALPQG